MGNKLKAISSNYNLEYFINKENINNQDLVKETIGYFETGEGARVFNPLELLNLLEKQRHFVNTNIQNKDKVIDELNALPLNEIEKHVLFGLLIKWIGGYPVSNLNEDFDSTYKEIQKEFLSYKGETPEKDFCKADFEERKKFMKMGIAFTTAINNPGVSASQLLEAMSETNPLEKVYNSFYELFEDAVINGALGEYENKQIYLIERSKYEFQFKVWLQESKGLEYGNESQYLKFLTKDFFIEFLIQVKKQDSKSTENQHIKAKWSIKTPHQAETSNQYEQSIRVNKLATIKDAERLGCKVGDPFSIIPEPTNIDEMFERLRKLHGQHVCESHQYFFSEIYGNGNIKIISDQLEKINEFIEDAESLSTVETFIEPINTISFNRLWMIISNRVKDRTNNDESLKLQNDIYLKHLIEYSRLKYGYYNNRHLNSSYVSFFSNIAAEVYGKYFLYRQWLEDKLDELNKGERFEMTDFQQKAFPLQITENNNSSDREIESVLKTISESCKEIVDDPELYHTLQKHFKKLGEKQGENHRTKHISKIFNKNTLSFKMEYQYSTGQSEERNSDGTIDFSISKNNQIITKGEALNFDGQNIERVNKIIIDHIKKLSDNYNFTRLDNLVFLVYYEGDREKFYDSYSNYRKHFAKCTEQVIKPTKAIDDISSDYVVNSASIKLAKSIHSYSGDTENEFSIYHFYIDFSEK